MEWRQVIEFELSDRIGKLAVAMELVRLVRRVQADGVLTPAKMFSVATPETFTVQKIRTGGDDEWGPNAAASARDLPRGA